VRARHGLRGQRQAYAGPAHLALELARDLGDVAPLEASDGQFVFARLPQAVASRQGRAGQFRTSMDTISPS